MYDERKTVVVGESALKHGLAAEYIERMWYDSTCEGFEVRRLPPQETNIIAIRFLVCPEGTLEMIAEDTQSGYYIFHAQIVPEGNTTNLIVEALRLSGIFGT